MDVDKLFKLPQVPVSGISKRKLADRPSEEVLKRFRPQESSGDSSIAARRAASVQDVEDEEQAAVADTDDQPVNGDDDEGRFFGGGLNEEQNHILDIFDQAGDDLREDGEALTLPALRRMLARFQAVQRKNAEQRGKFPDDPSKFIESEADLDAAIKRFLPLTQNPALYYPELVSSGAISMLVNLLSHENTDIAVDVVQVLQELTDEDVGDMDEAISGDEDEENGEAASATRLAMAQLIDELLAHSVFQLLEANLRRLDEQEETDRQGVFQVLAVFENLLSFMPPLADEVGSATNILSWLLERLARRDFDSNKQYASEILSILVQSRNNLLKLLDLQGMDVIVSAAAQYRAKDPQDSEEEEFMANCFDIICSMLSVPQGKDQFSNLEGVELMVIMVKSKLQSRPLAIKVLDFAMQGPDGTAECEAFVEATGLKYLFSAFMGKGAKSNAAPHEDVEHILGVLVSLFSNLPSDSSHRIRLIAKFVENGYEKVDRLLEIREGAVARLATVSREVDRARQVMLEQTIDIDEDQETEWYMRRLEGGLSALQAADYVLAWICMEDDGVRAHVQSLLERKGLSLAELVQSLTERASYLEPTVDDEDQEAVLQQRAVLENLLAFLQGL